MDDDQAVITRSKKALTSERAQLAPSRVLEPTTPEKTGKGLDKLARRSTIGVPGEDIKPKLTASRSLSKLKSSVGRVILGHRAVSAFKADRQLEAEVEEAPPPLVDEGGRAKANKELMQSYQGVVTARRWLFMDARIQLTKRKELEPPKNLRELLKLAFLIVRQAVRRQELKRRVVTVFWEALYNKTPDDEKRQGFLPAIPTEPEKPSLDFSSKSALTGKLLAIKEARAWLQESSDQWTGRQDRKEATQKHLAKMEALSKSSQSHLDDLLSLKNQIESGILSAQAMEKSMENLMSKPWLREILGQKRDTMQVGLQPLKGSDAEKNKENNEYETKHGNEEESEEQAGGEELDSSSSACASSMCPLDVESISGDSTHAGEAAEAVSEDPGSCEGQQQPVQKPKTTKSKPAKTKTRDNCPVGAPKLHTMYRTARTNRSTGNTDAPDDLAGTEPVAEAECSEELRNKCLKDLALIGSLWSDIMESAGGTLSGQGDVLSPSDEHSAPAVAPAAEKSQEPLTLAAQPDNLIHDGVEVHEPTIFVQPLAESDEQRVQTEEPTAVVDQKRFPEITIVVEQSESVTVPSFSSDPERQTSKQGARQLSKRSSTANLELPSADRAGSGRPTPRASSKSSLKSALSAPGAVGSRSSSKVRIAVEEPPRRRASKTAASPTEDVPRRPIVQRSGSLPGLVVHTDDADSQGRGLDSPVGMAIGPVRIATPVGMRRTSSKTSSGQAEEPRRSLILHKSATFHQGAAADEADSPGRGHDSPSAAAAKLLRRSLSTPPCDKSNEAASNESAAVMRRGGRRSEYLAVLRQPTHEALRTVVGTPTMAQALAAGRMPSRDVSPAPMVGSMGQSRRSSKQSVDAGVALEGPTRPSSKQTTDGGAGLEAVATGRAGSKSPAAEKKAGGLRLRSQSSAALGRGTNYRLLPDRDQKSLLITGTELIGG